MEKKKASRNPLLHNPLGRPPIYTPEGLWEKFEEYISWAEENPYYATSRTDYANGFADTREAKIHRISLEEFFLFAGTSRRWWSEIQTGKNGEAFSEVKENIKNFCESWQKNVASAGLLNANIISRLLGLVDKKEVDHKGEERVLIMGSKEEAEKVASIKDLDV